MFGFVSLMVSVVSLVVSCIAYCRADKAFCEAAEAMLHADRAKEQAEYAIEVGRKYAGLPYNHAVLGHYEKSAPAWDHWRTQTVMSDRAKDDAGIVDADDAFEMFSDGTYRIVPNSGAFSVLKPVFCRVHGVCDDPACPYTISLGVSRARTSLVLCPRTGVAYIDTGVDELVRVSNALQVLSSSGSCHADGREV